MSTAGRLIMPCALPSMAFSSGEWLNSYGMRMPNHSSTRLKYSLQAMATVAAPTQYSRRFGWSAAYSMARATTSGW